MNAAYGRHWRPKQQVVRFCQLKGLELLKPSKSAPEIVIIDRASGFGRVICKATSWKQAVATLYAHFHSA